MVTLMASPAFAGPRKDKLDLALRQAVKQGATDNQRVIISVNPGMRPLLRAALKKHGDTVVVEHPSIEALTADVHGQDILALEKDPAVKAVAIDATVVASARKKVTAGRAINYRALKYYSGLRAQLGLTGNTLTGSGVGVAVIDSGIAPVPDLEGRIRHFVDFTRTSTPLPVEPYDDYGHGTYVAGLIGGTGVQSRYQYMGVAPLVHFVGLKVLDHHGQGRASNVLAAIDYAVANADLFGIDVINLSLGHPIYAPAEDDPLVQAVERAVRHGIVVVISAGNFGENPQNHQAGYAGITSPGNAPSAITVGAVRTMSTLPRSDDRIPDWSSRGPSWYDAYAKPDIVAPGDRLISDCLAGQTIATSFPSLRVPGRNDRCYIALSGTSVSAAVASGAVAIVIDQVRQANEHGPEITPNAVKAILQYTAIPVSRANGRLYDGLTQGTGGLNLDGAVTVAQLIDTSMPLNSTWVAAVPEPVSELGGEQYAWAQNIVWGGNRVTDDNVLYVNTLAWAANIVWGGALDGDNIVWGTLGDGDNIVWGTAGDWGDNIVWGTGLLTTADGDNIVWGTLADGDNIVWGTIDGDNIVWGTIDGDGDNIVWGTAIGDDGDNIVWGTGATPRKRK